MSDALKARILTLYGDLDPVHATSLSQRLVAEYGNSIHLTSPKDLQTIFIEPAAPALYDSPGRCKVYALPYPMRAGQHPRDLQERFRKDWREIGMLTDNNSRLVYLDPDYADLADALPGTMAGTIFPYVIPAARDNSRLERLAQRAQTLWTELQGVLAEITQSPAPLPKPAFLPGALHFPLSREAGEDSPYLARVALSNFGAEYQEIYVDLVDRGQIDKARLLDPTIAEIDDVAMVASICISLNKDRQPQVLVTSDGMGNGDHNIVACPLKSAEDAVEIDAQNSRSQRLHAPAGPGQR